VGLDVTWAVKWLTLSAQAMAEHRVELIELDRAIGDSDHGENMDRGFQAVLDKLAENPPETPGAALKLTAMALMSKVGGAAGPLYGTAFLRAATTLGDAADVDSAARRLPRRAPWPPTRWWHARAGPATSGSAVPATVIPERPRAPSFSAPPREPPHDGADRGGFAQ
jgi:hypothetical protein